MSEPLFYVIDKQQPHGELVLFWLPNGNGYTADIDEAGKYSERDLIVTRAQLASDDGRAIILPVDDPILNAAITRVVPRSSFLHEIIKVAIRGVR